MSKQYERKIILVGKTGDGKSSLGNVLLGRQAFSVGHGFSAETKKCQFEPKGEYASVVDTPGLFDSDVRTSLFQNALEIQRAVQLCPKPHAFLIVLNRKAKLTKEELLAIDVLCIIFGEQFLKKAVIVFTNTKNDLDKKELKGMINKCEEMKHLIKQCEGRFCRINNRNPTPEYIDEIKSLVDIVSRMGADCFKNDFIDVHKEELEKSLAVLDSKPVHDQIKQLTLKILQAVEKEKDRRVSKKKLVVGFFVAGAALTCVGGGVAVVATGVSTGSVAATAGATAGAVANIASSTGSVGATAGAVANIASSTGSVAAAGAVANIASCTVKVAAAAGSVAKIASSTVSVAAVL